MSQASNSPGAEPADDASAITSTRSSTATPASGNAHVAGSASQLQS
ncbi:MAG: hypothetical protein H6739_12905 [Alphaproteobacteria bacterium]|nr:hypothetical protein [Alphaproteobacteria bacterium]